MFLMRFTERAYVNYTAEDVKNSPNSAVRLTFSNRHFDPQLGADLYNAYLDEYEYCEEVGFDGLMLNEHHNTPTCILLLYTFLRVIGGRTHNTVHYR